MGRWRGAEGAIEVTVPLTVTGLAWYFVYSIMGLPSGGRPFTWMEIYAIVGMAVALTSWMLSRQMFLARKRYPRTLVTSGVITSLILAYIISGQVISSFETTCTDVYEGEVVYLTPVDEPDSFQQVEGTGSIACRLGGVVGNPYLIGSVFRPRWDGNISTPLFLFLLMVSVLSSLGLRSLKLKPTAISFKLMNLLRFAPAAGTASAMGSPKPKLCNVVACNNATLWGEICGQMYSAEKKFYPGEWCSRCQQAFVPTPRRFTFKVVSLFTGDVDVLNGIERIDTVSWPRGDAIAPDGRISGQERWVQLGTIELPDVLTMSQVLALVHEMLPKWTGGDDVRKRVAGRVAMDRASRVSAWIWRGSLSHRLTYARPNGDASLGIGPMRLRDLIEDASEELWLQLDIGLLPMEVRVGFKKSFIEEGRLPELQNSKYDLWVPVANPNNRMGAGNLWVPRIEGDALRAWLSTDRRDEKLKGVTIPLPYLRYDSLNKGPAPEGHDKAPEAGSLDMVRYPLGPRGMEPTAERDVGASLAEWDWLEWRQIELLRHETLVLEVEK
jgi:hypothetical protein